MATRSPGRWLNLIRRSTQKHEAGPHDELEPLERPDLSGVHSGRSIQSASRGASWRDATPLSAAPARRSGLMELCTLMTFLLLLAPEDGCGAREVMQAGIAERDGEREAHHHEDGDGQGDGHVRPVRASLAGCRLRVRSVHGTRSLRWGSRCGRLARKVPRRDCLITGTRRTTSGHGHYWTRQTRIR